MSDQDDQVNQPGQSSPQDTWLQNPAIGVSKDQFDQVASSANDGGGGSPTISVTAKGDGSFSVKGSGFLKKATVTLRVVDEYEHQFWAETTSDGAGGITFATPGICQREGKVHFSAVDGRPNRQDLTGNLWSNTAHSECAGPAAPEKGDDDPDPGGDDPPKSEESPGDSIAGGATGSGEAAEQSD